MSWTVAQWLEGGDTVIVSIDDEFRNVAQRGESDTRVFEKRLVPALQAHGGVLVAGITRTNPISYTFLGYCMEGIEPAVIPVDEALRRSCTVSVCRDPQWTEFESWIPAEPRGLSRVAATLRSLLYKLYARR